MAVYPWCTTCNCRRDAPEAGGLECSDKTGHKRAVGWWADVRLGDKNRVRKFYGPKFDAPKELADAFERGLKTDRQRGELRLNKKPPTLFGPLADKYWIEHASIEGRHPERNDLYTVERAKRWIGVDRKVSPLTDEELDVFRNDLRSLQRQLQGKGLSGATINRNFNIIRSVFERGREWGMVKENPLEFVGRVKEDKPAVRFLEQTEIDKLFCAIDNLLSEYGNPIDVDRKRRLTEFMTVLSHTGARPSSIEECSFDNGDVDFQNRVVVFTTYKGGQKKKHRYPVPMDDEVFAVVMRRAEETGRKGPVFDCKDMLKLTRLVVEQSGVNEGKPENMHFTIYGLKHCFASHLLMSGATEREVAELLGHTDTRMVHQHYGHLTIEHLRKVQSRINLTRPQLKVV